MIAFTSCMSCNIARCCSIQQHYELIQKLVAEGEAIEFCPTDFLNGDEIEWPLHIDGGDGFDIWEDKARIFDAKGKDWTEYYKQASIQTYAMLKDKSVDTVVLKDNNLLCGILMRRLGTAAKGQEITGVFSAYLINKKMVVFKESEFVQYLDYYPKESISF